MKYRTMDLFPRYYCIVRFWYCYILTDQMYVHIVNTHKAVPVAERWTAASEGTPSHVRAHGGGAELCPDSPASPSGSPAASPSLSACWPLRTPGSPYCLPRLLLLGAPSRWSHLLPSCRWALRLLPLQEMTALRLSRFAHPRIWWASPHTSSWDRGVCLCRFNEENYAADCAWKMSLFVPLGSFFYMHKIKIFTSSGFKNISFLWSAYLALFIAFFCAPPLSPPLTSVQLSLLVFLHKVPTCMVDDRNARVSPCYASARGICGNAGGVNWQRVRRGRG